MEIFINVHKKLKQFTITPVTTCSAERIFSKRSVIKTKLRSQIDQKIFNSMMMIFVERELVSQMIPGDMIEEFKSMYTSS